MVIVRPSVQPSSASRCTKAAVHGAHPEASAPRNPIAGGLRDGWAAATSAKAPAPQPRSATTSRLFNGRIFPLMVSGCLGGYIETARTRQEGTIGHRTVEGGKDTGQSSKWPAATHTMACCASY